MCAAQDWVISGTITVSSSHPNELGGCVGTSRLKASPGGAVKWRWRALDQSNLLKVYGLTQVLEEEKEVELKSSWYLVAALHQLLFWQDLP